MILRAILNEPLWPYATHYAWNNPDMVRCTPFVSIVVGRGSWPGVSFLCTAGSWQRWHDHDRVHDSFQPVEFDESPAADRL